MNLITGNLELKHNKLKFQIQFDENEHKNLELNIENVNKDALDELNHLDFIDKICGISGFYYIFYNCKIISHIYNMSKDPMNMDNGKMLLNAHLIFSYDIIFKILDTSTKKDYLICNIDYFNRITFTFSNIDKIFHKDKFYINNETQFEKLTIVKDKLDVRSIDIKDFTLYVGNDVHNSANSCYDIEIHQKRIIDLRYKNKKSFNDILDDVIKIKHYFEFILQTEIEIKDLGFFYIELINDVNYLQYSGNLIYFEKFKNFTNISYNASSTLFDCKKVNILDGLLNWFESYSKLIKSIEIWQKIIYNANKSKIDEIIWYCQALELFCASFDDLSKNTKLLRNPRQKEPNIGNCVNSVKKFFFIEGPEITDYKTINKVRNKCIHNNPDLVVSNDEINSTYKILKYYYLSAILKFLNVNGIDVNGLINPKLDTYGNFYKFKKSPWADWRAEKSPFRHHKFDGDCLKDTKVGVKF